jgi:hypothetical protein
MIVERVDYDVNWRKFKRGTSIFIPCLDSAAAKKEILTTTNRLRLNIVMKVVIEEGVRGIRFWRV